MNVALKDSVRLSQAPWIRFILKRHETLLPLLLLLLLLLLLPLPPPFFFFLIQDGKATILSCLVYERYLAIHRAVVWIQYKEHGTKQSKRATKKHETKIKTKHKKHNKKTKQQQQTNKPTNKQTNKQTDIQKRKPKIETEITIFESEFPTSVPLYVKPSRGSRSSGC